MRDSVSPRHYIPPSAAAAPSTGVSSSHHNRQPHHSQNHHQYQNRPPFSPTNPKNVTNRSSSIEGDHHNSSNDPWKMNNKFPTSSLASFSTKLLPPNPEGRITSNSTLPRVTSAPNQTVRRTFARGRLMEGPTATTSTTMTTNTSTNMDVWEGVNDDPAAWATTATTSTNIMNDDSTWFVGDEDIVVNETSKNSFSNTNNEKNRKTSTIGASIPSPFNWGRRTRSNNDVGNSYSSGSSSNMHNNNNAPFDFPSTDPWRLSNGASADSGERSLYDDSGEKIIRHTPATSNRRLTSPKTTFVPLGSPSRPISTAITSATTDYHTSEADGSLTRPIAIHDCADALDEREQDVLQNAARKQKGNNILLTESRTKNSAGISAIIPTISEPLQRSRNNAITMDDDIRDSDILQKATKRRQGLLEKKKNQQQSIVNENHITSAVAFNKPIPLDMNLSKIETSSQADESAQQITPKQNKGLLGFFRGGGLGGGKRAETKKKSKGLGANQLDSPMSRSSRIGDSRKDQINTISTFSMKRPSPLNVWSPSTEKSKISARSKSPANVWTALSDKSDETEPNPTCDNDNGKSSFIADHKPIVLQATTTTLSSDKGMKPDIVYGSDTLLEQQGHVGSTDTNDDGTTVSGVTNPSFFPEDKPTKKNTFHDRSTSFLSKSGDESFNVNSPVFSSGRISGRIAPSPRDKASSALPALSDDDFSDPFFPNGTEDVTKEESGVSEAPDPDIDHVGIGTDNESDDNNHALIGSRKERHKRFIVRKAVVARSNESKAKMQIDDPKIQPVQVNKAVTTGTGESVTQNIIDHRNSVLSRRDRKNATATASIQAEEIEARPVFVPTRTMVSERISEMENKPKPSFKRGSPYRRGQLRHRDSATGVGAKKQVFVETHKVIQTSKNIPPIIGRRAKINEVEDRSIAVLAKSSSESTIAAEPTSLVKSFSSNEEVGHHSVKRLGRSGDLSISSVGSDIQRLRSILRRSRIQGNGDNVRYIEPLESAFATYDETQIKDPMQRAGLRLLSAAVVPIQSAVRRHLAFRSALTRMWAIVTIQAATRRWLVRYDDFRWATIKLQALYRGSRVRDQILLEHCCAIEIQRHVRGLIASWYVYDEIYKIKLVQACVRRKLAMERAMDRMVSIIQIQSICRGFLLRMRQKRLITAVTKVQSAWRAFTCRFTYQLDILDIIIMQSVWRKKIAQLKFVRLQHEHQISCAVKIQSQWRSYDCSMNYLHYIADVLIAQSVVRRYLAIRRCNQIRNNNALVMQKAVRSFLARILVKRIRSVILIQSAYRGFVCYADYMFTISDIVLAQSVARRWLKQKDYPQKLHDHKSKAAVVIQKHWRGFSQITDYYVMRQENKSAIVIQSAWRRFFHFSIFIVVIDSAIRIQSSCRGFLVREKLAWQSHAALIIQCAYRVLSAKKNLSRALAAQELFSSSKGIAIQHRQAVTNIQRVIRGAQVRDAVGLYTRTRIFQSAWRGYRARKLYCQHVNARRIQSIWRRHVAVADFDIYRKARTLQSAWRRYLASSTFALYIKVRAIQSRWRGYAARSSYNIYRGARSIQKVWRGYEKRSAYKIYLKSRLIQATWRAYSARTSYVIFIQARMIQLAWRKHLAIAALHKHHAAKRTQAIWRGYVVRTTVALYIQARSIQAAWRGYLVRMPYKEYIACRCIQSSWRRRMAVQCLNRHIKARRVQTWWRCNSQRVIFETHKANVAATYIQALWRCKSVSSAYKSFLAARCIQTAWRGTSISRAYKHFMNVRLVQALWRGRVVRNAYRQHNSARNIQAVWRGRTIHIAYRHYVAARRIQTMWRGQSICKAYTKYRSACCIQSVWRGRLICRAYKEYLMARRIQTFWRCTSLCAAHNKFKKDRRLRYTAFYSVCKIQALWRRKSLETAFKQYLAVVRIQSFWRAASVYNTYEFYRTDRLHRRVQFEAARKIQSNWRSKALSYTYKLFKTSLSARYVHNSSALRIQTSWRAASLHKAFAQFIAARNIQASWRRKLIQSAYLQFMACRRIQASWRGKQVRTAYNQFISTRQMQDSYYKKLFANDSPQVSDVGLLCLNPRKSINHIAATKIAAAWRGFTTCQRYWHVLGSVIEIQTIVRGWLARRKLKDLQENALVQLRTINAIKYKSIARSRNSRLQTNDRNEKKRTDKAARTIQRFFSMVKAEVDREIRAEKKRRKVKKRARKNRSSFDEKLLESVWRKTIEDDLKYLDYKRSMKATVAATQAEKKRVVPKLISKGSEDSRLSTGREMMSLCGTPMSASGRLGVVPLSVNSFKFDVDDTSKSALKRYSKSRVNSMSPREIDEDFLLEEAWIDSKIISAKERRGAHRIIGPSQLTRPSSSKARSIEASEFKLPPTMPVHARRPTGTIDSSSDRRPPRRTQAV